MEMMNSQQVPAFI